MVREDLIDGAVTFLQDPSVSSAPIEQKISFLRSKNLTQEEIDASLARVGQPSAVQAPPQGTNYPPQYRQSPAQYGAYQQQSYWGQPAQEVPRRDWRDWFIMATVVGGVGYAMYWTAMRYVYPLLAPPTPPQLEQDKASIDASFEKAFALLEQLASDTQELKDSEQARKERLDHALGEVESVVGKMKEANESRELEAKRMAREIEEIKDQIPQAIQKEKENTENRLKDLAVEMKSLKTLVGNRMGQNQRTTPSISSQAPNGVNGASTPVPAYVSTPETNGANVTVEQSERSASTPAERPASSTTYGRILGGKAQIPSWQLAAKKRNEEAKKDSATEAGAPTDVLENGTHTKAESGA